MSPQRHCETANKAVIQYNADSKTWQHRDNIASGSPARGYRADCRAIPPIAGTRNGVFGGRFIMSMRGSVETAFLPSGGRTEARPYESLN
jgi:hypothetical protein